jgi:hypothetical protein
MSSPTTITVSCTQRDGSRLQVVGFLGSGLLPSERYTHDLYYKIGVDGTYTALDTTGKNISIAEWSESFDVGTNETVYLRYRATSTVMGEFGELPIPYTAFSPEILSVSYNKKKTARSTKVKKSIATQNTTRREIPNI